MRAFFIASNNMMINTSMKLHDIILNEMNSFSDTKRDNGYNETFLPIDGIWTDTILRLLRYEPPYKSDPAAKGFSDKVEQFFDRKYGNMIYHKGDEDEISIVFDSNWNSLEADSSIANIKDRITQTTHALNKLAKAGTIAPEGSHKFETDFWLDQREKEDYMRRRR